MNDLAPAPRRHQGSAQGPIAAAAGASAGSAAGASGSATDNPKQGLAAAMAWVTSTYFAEGLPWSIVHQVSAEMFTALGQSLQVVGYTALYGLTWNFKGAWSPLLTMFGTTRRWLLGIEVALAIAIGAIAWPAGVPDLASVAIALAAVAFLGATHDIAIDGFYMRALPSDRQVALSGLRVSAYRVAMLAGKGLLVLIAGLTSWRVCFLAAAGTLLALAALHAALLPREERPPKGEARPGFLEAFTTFLAQPNIGWTLAFILVFRAGDALMFAMSPPLLKNSLGLGTAARATLSGLIGTSTSIAGSMLGSAIIARYGIARTLRPISALQSAAILLYVWLAWAKPGIVGVGVIIALEQLIAGVGTAALLVFLMRCSAGKHKTSHFAIGTSLMSVATTLLGTVSGHVAEAVGFTSFFALAFAASLPGVALSFMVSLPNGAARAPMSDRG